MADDLAQTAGRDYGDTLWTPSAAVIEHSVMTDYMRWLADRGLTGAGSYPELWEWSVRDPAEFWTSIWDYFGVVGDKGAGPVLSGELPAARWFTEGKLNYARNALRHARSAPERVAVRYSAETGRAGELTFAELSRDRKSVV